MIARLLICPSLETLRSNLEGYRTNHPDILYFKAGEKLGIAQARQIKGHFSLKPYSAKGRTVVLEDAGVLTAEAQNALLKTLEELPPEAVLILGASSGTNLLPTVLSRCEITNLTQSLIYNNKYTEDIDKLLNSSIEERFEYIEKLKDREEFLAALAAYFHRNILRFPDFTKQLLQTEQWQKQNVSIRAILEYLMLVMPAKI